MLVLLLIAPLCITLGVDMLLFWKIGPFGRSSPLGITIKREIQFRVQTKELMAMEYDEKS